MTLNISLFLYCVCFVITVPVLHSYVDDDGYYITARPSDVGNITYQVSERAETLFSDLDYRDEDDLPWGITNPLRSAGLIYTDSQGVNHNQDDALFQYIGSEDPTVASLLESYLMTLRI